MQIGGGLKNVDSNVQKPTSLKRESGLSPLLMYNEPPKGNIEFEEFTNLALDRFALLQLFENVGTRCMKYSNDYFAKLEVELRKLGFLKSILVGPADAIEETDLNKDAVSNFILRLAFCQTEDLKRWFITHEIDLFRYKLNRVANDSYAVEKFLKDNELVYTPISDVEKQTVIDGLVEMGTSHTQVNLQNYYKINFLEVIELVKSRRVFLKGGFAYVTISEFSWVLAHVFRARMSKSLSILSRHIKEIEEDHRIADLLKVLRERDVGDNYANSQAKDHLTAESLEAHAIKSYPICMRNLHEALKNNHHLRHFGRLQYALYLKGIGLSLEESLRFFRTEFSRGAISVDKFDKDYAYNIRHSYGKEGKRTSYTPYSCLKIITSNMPGNNDYHGCPYKHFERDFLKQKLRQYGRTEEETGAIMEQVDSNNYQIACQRYFEFSHKTDELVPINHPNQYFESSMQILNSATGNTNKAAKLNSSYVKKEYAKVEMNH